MSALAAWSSKYITYRDGDMMWIRSDHVDRMRPRMEAAGHVATGKIQVTGGKVYQQFLLNGGQDGNHDH